MMAHWAPDNPINRVPNGFIGVTFFFVLSGYLISSNLLYLKRSIMSGELSTGKALRIFYIRRTLRIFPLYFFVILAVYFAAKPMFEGNVAWYLTYLPNILMYNSDHWPGMLSHFWSLGVEEQFYLIWPLLIFTVGWKWMRPMFIGVVSFSLLFKFIFFFHDPAFSAKYFLLPISSFDAFCIGAILALKPFSGRSRQSWIDKIGFLPGFLSSVLLSALAYIGGLFFLFPLLLSCLSFFIIRQAQSGFKGLFGRIVDLPVLRYLGKISYGLYVYHNFMPWIWRCITGRETANPLPITLFRNPVLNKPPVALATQVVLLVLVASASWFILEKPLNDLKNVIAGSGEAAKEKPAAGTINLS